MSENTTFQSAPLFPERQLSGLLGIMLLLNLCLSSHFATAQEDAVIREITARLAESLPETADLSELTERLSYYQQHPIELNHAKPEQLKELVFLSGLQISNFFSHLKSGGPLKDLLELQAIDEFDLETIDWLLHFVTLNAEKGYNGLHFKKLISQGNQEILLRYGQTLEQQKGFKDLPGSRYLGSPQKLLFKYKYNLGDVIAFSFAVDKDAGESLFSSNSKSGFDFLSGSLALYKTGRFRQIIIGDYSLQFGQGLSLWSGSSFGKGPDVAGVAKKDTGLKPYTSTNEYSFFRGIGTKFKLLEKIDLTTFISSRSLDASLSSTTEGKYTLQAIGTSGLHRTKTEIANHGDLKMFLYGAAAEFSQTGFDAGIVVYHSSYQHEFVTGSRLYKQDAFYGKDLTNLGFHYSYTFKNIYFFGEAALSDPGGPAILNGAMASLSPVISVVLVHRDYAKDHMTFYSQALGNGSSAANEKGLYAGLHVNKGKQWSTSIYLDLFRSPGARYRVDSTSSGHELMWQISFTPRKTFKVILKLNLKQDEQNESAALPVNPLVSIYKNNYRTELHWKLNRKISMQNRLEMTQYSKGASAKQYGYLFYQDADYSPLSSRIAGNIRLAYFNTPVYENRVYAYEDDVLYGAGSGLYNGRGFRTFLNLNYRLSKRLRIWGRYAVFIYPGKERTGSGLDEIMGNRKSDIRVQLRCQF